MEKINLEIRNNKLIIKASLLKSILESNDDFEFIMSKRIQKFWDEVLKYGICFNYDKERDEFTLQESEYKEKGYFYNLNDALTREILTKMINYYDII